MQNAKVRVYVNYLYIWSGVWALLRIRNLEYFILIIKPCGMLRVSPHMVEELGENWQRLSLPSQFNQLRQGSFVGEVCWRSVRLSLLLCALLRERALGRESRHETFATLV